MGSRQRDLIIPVEDVIMLSGSCNYTIFLLTGSRKIILSRSLKNFEQILAKFKFVRVHKRYLINMDQVERYDKNNCTVIMSESLYATVSRRRKVYFEAHLRYYLSRKKLHIHNYY